MSTQAKLQEVRKEQIRNFVIANRETMDNFEIAKILEVNPIRIAGVNNSLVRFHNFKKINWDKKVTNHTEKKAEEKSGTIINNVTNNITNIYNGITNEIDNDIIGNYKNGYGKNKLHAKEKMANHIINTGIQGHIVTLTNVHTEMEEVILKALPNTTYTAVECELPIFEKMQMLFPSRNLPMKLHHGFMSDMIYGVDSNSYAHMILDYCLDLTQHAKEIEHVIEKNLVGVGGIIALTTNKTNRRGSGEMWDYITGLSDEATINRRKDNRCKTEIENERFLYSILGRNYKIIEVFSYYDRYPMTLTIIQRIK